MERSEIEEKYGPWRTNMELTPGKYAIGVPYGAEWSDRRTKLYALFAEQTLGKPIRTLRVLDVGCGEGANTIYFAKLGADATGLEGLEANWKKCEIARQGSGLRNLRFVHRDMLFVDRSLGVFDVVLAAGILYHLDGRLLQPFLARLKSVCRGVLILDTHYSLEPNERLRLDRGKMIYGSTVTEHSDSAPVGKNRVRTWGSLHDSSMFWPTERSLMNLLKLVGFWFVFRPTMPFFEWPSRDRLVWVADARPRQGVHVEMEDYVEPDPRVAFHDEVGKPPPLPEGQRVADDRWALLQVIQKEQRKLGNLFRGLLGKHLDIQQLEQQVMAARLLPPPDFDEQSYVNLYEDVATALEKGEFASGFDHYMKHGRAENRPRPKLLPKA